MSTELLNGCVVCAVVSVFGFVVSVLDSVVASAFGFVVSVFDSVVASAVVLDSVVMDSAVASLEECDCGLVLTLSCVVTSVEAVVLDSVTLLVTCDLVHTSLLS